MNRNRHWRLRATSVLCGLALAGITLADDDVAIVSEGVAASVCRPDAAVPPMTAGYPSKIADRTDDACIGIGYLL